ncbi:replication factor C small subunit [Thermococcus sp.]|uniref:replication factor C small subunit n=1 Tax=Thermococcus sp. TaxID=35749 RepID=UPI00076CCDF4|nr:replication factor C small subunit [Thermococcus sp.]KUK29028.1 MAG: Replication factor C small subunit [Thermococcus sp. 40_45]MBC7095358.1 replication factor C small subunit [Thermococcus sp.]
MVEEVKEVKEVKILEKPWVEKYRPERLDDIVGQDHIVKRLKHYVKTASMPHLLFAGPPGTGKTTSSLALARELFGEHWRHNFLELNASVSKDTPILVRINGRVMRTTFAELDKLYFNESDGEVAYKDASNLEVLTVDENYCVKWAQVSKIIRHHVPVILQVHLEGGGKLELTGNHSVMVLTENGLETVKASELKEGTILLSFTTNIEGFLDVLDMSDYSIKESARTRTFKGLSVDEELSYIFGLYAAEGAVGFNGNTSGQVIYTLGSHEGQLIERIKAFVENLGVSVYENYTSSGFDRSRKSAYQFRLLNTQLARFFEESFYDGNGRRANNKRLPGFVFEFPIRERIAFLKGLADGDGTGEWGGVIRVSSVSRDLLIDTVWLARVSGIEASLFEREARLIWKGGMKWSKAELLPAEPIVKMLEAIENAIEGNWRYEFRHQLYEGKKRVRKATLRKAIEMVNEEKLDEKGKRILEVLKKLANTDLHALLVRKIELVEYNDFVYDVSVPGNEMFFAGEIPVLLHNSDERGINVIREKVKEFARTKPIGGVSFKIIFLDEADALTQDAQQALRRTMEMFSSNVRFILSCNYSSKIIEPIQSRCAIFRFRPLKDEDVARRLKYIAENEGLELTEEGLQAILYVAEGDLRRAINVLQAAAALDTRITDENVFLVASRARPEDVREMMLLALEGNFLKARDKLREILLKQGLSGEDVLIQMHKEVFNLPISEPKKVALADKIGEYNFRLVEGSNEMIQLEALLAQFTLLGKD